MTTKVDINEIDFIEFLISGTNLANDIRLEVAIEAARVSRLLSSIIRKSPKEYSKEQCEELVNALKAFQNYIGEIENKKEGT